MNKKLISSISALVVATTLFAGCAKTDNGTSNGGDTTKTIKVGLTTDEGGLNDKSFNQSADEGLKKAVTDLKVEYKAIEAKTKDDYESNLDALVADGSKLVFAVGYQMEQAMLSVADKHSDTNFVIIDTVVDKPNVVSYNFKEQEGSFLMGVIAGKMTKTNKVGFIGGKDSPLIKRFEVGYIAGVKSVNPEAGEALEKGGVVYAESFEDTSLGKEAAKNLMNKGVDVIYHAAGGVGVGMFQAIQEAKDSGKEVWGIGVDMDQSLTLPQFSGIILSSMIKRVDTATYEATKSLVDGSFKGGTSVNLGIKEGAVDIASTSEKNTPKEVLDLVNKYKEQIKEGKITVPSTLDELKNFKAVEVK